MDPHEKCVSVLKALAHADARGSLSVVVVELDAFARAVGGESEVMVRALSDLAENFQDQAPETDTAAMIGDEISRRIDQHVRLID